jgi:hypothetical protein
MEKLMQYVWQHRLFNPSGLKTVDGRSLTIINPGQLNTDAGPDFFNATIEIDRQKWVGNIEIHVRASDWFRHKHDRDRAYDNVILHVVDNDDMIIKRADGSPIPQMQLSCSPTLNADYHHLTDTSPAQLSCADAISQIPKVFITDWIDALAYERIQQKSDRIDTLVKNSAGDWEQASYITVARSLGFSTNSDPFERLARATPIRFLRKHSDSIITLEAFLFGQAGLLEKISSTDSYASGLAREYKFLVNKFGLRRPDFLGWKMSKMRPQNFPYRRIALLAQMIFDGYSIMSKIAAIQSIDDARKIFNHKLTGYWVNHYTFSGQTIPYDINLSRASIDLLIINAAVPLLYSYSIAHGDLDRAEFAVELLHQLKPESNSMITMFANNGIKSPDAFTSQALIQLRREYCEKRKCLFCRIGHRHLARCAIRK